MIYIFDKQQNIIGNFDSSKLIEGHLKFKTNSAAELTFTLPPSNALLENSKYIALPHPLNKERFIFLRLTSRVDNNENIEYSAFEYAYQELATNGYIQDKRPQESDAKTLMTMALDGTGWVLNNYNVAKTAKTNFYYITHLEAISNVIELLGGEIYFYIDIKGNKIVGKYMDYMAVIGKDTSKVFVQGSNLLTVTRKKDTSSIYTAILPRGKGELVSSGKDGSPDGYGRRIDIADVVWDKSKGSPLNKAKGDIILNDPYATAEWGQISGNARLLIQTYDQIDDPNVLINQAYQTLMSVNHPQVQYSASVADVEGLSLGDSVMIMHSERNLSYKTRVFEIDYDLINEKNTQISLGDDLSQRSITSQINNIKTQLSTTSNQTQFTISQTGRESVTYGVNPPENPLKGDVWFKYYPTGETEIWIYDGTIWEKIISPTTAQDIAHQVDDALVKSKQYTDTSIENNNVLVNHTIDEVSKKNAADAIAAGNFDYNAQKMADKAREDAISAANDSAQANLSQAEQDITAAYQSADGVINKKVDDTASSITTTINQNKIDADGKISTAQSTATQALDEVKLKVSQTDYDQKTGDLTTAVGQAQLTADEAKTTIGNYQKSNDDRVQSAETEIKQNADALTLTATKQSVKDLDDQVNYRAFKIENDVSQIKIDNQSITESVSKNSDDIKQTNDRVQTAEGTLSRVSDDLTHVESSQTQMADQITTEIQDRKNGDTNTLTQANGYTNSKITDYDTGIQTQLTQTSNSIIATVEADTKTQISLSQNSYQMGINSDGQLVSGFGGNMQGVYIKGNAITLDGNTTVTGDFYAKGGNFKNLNASNIVAGTLDGNLANIININASNITTGNLTGVQVGITNGGRFYANQLGTIYDFTDNPYYYQNQSSGNQDPWIRIDQIGTYSLGSDGTRLNISGTVTAPDAYIGSTKQYAWYTQRDSGIQSGTNKLNTYAELGMTGLRISQEDADNPSQTGGYSFFTGHGMYIGYNQNNPRFSVNTSGDVYANTIKLISGRSWQQINGATTDLAKLQQGQDLQFYVGSSNTLNLYSNQGNVSLASKGVWMVQARQNGYLYLGNIKYGSGGASLQIALDGAVTALSSSVKYKTNLEYDPKGDAGEKLLTLDPLTWQDKGDDEQIRNYKENGIEPDHQIDMSNRRYYGLLAEDMVKANLDDFVIKDEKTGELHGIQYEKIGAALIPVIRNLRNMVLEQKLEIERLKEK